MGRGFWMCSLQQDEHYREQTSHEEKRMRIKKVSLKSIKYFKMFFYKLSIWEWWDVEQAWKITMYVLVLGARVLYGENITHLQQKGILWWRVENEIDYSSYLCNTNYLEEKQWNGDRCNKARQEWEKEMTRIWS